MSAIWNSRSKSETARRQDAKNELSAWDGSLRVSSRGYMLGYNDFKDPSVSGFFRFLARVGDGMMKMQIVKIGFGEA